ncbi:MAG: acyl-CoA dehydrogenase family protein [Planctomycetota bacterium]|nr:acyl-CoA dehydrogenase family protein [Planctomycetota bacterium]
MDFEFSEDHLMLQQSLREFADEVVAPGAAERDLSAEFPDELRRQFAEMGLFGSYVPEEYGGAGMDITSYALIVEEISRACAASGVVISAHTSLCVDPILHFGTDKQKQHYLPKLAGGEWIGCLSLTEPGSGSDAGAATCTAELKDDGWHINGRKCFVTNGKEARVMMLIAVTAPTEKKRRQSAFIVEHPWPGLTIGKLEKKLGIRCSSTAEYVFGDCIIPKDNLLGEVGKGLNIALATLDGGRIGIAAQALGIAEACLEKSIEYSKQRRQFDQPICNFQAIQHKLSDMKVGIEAARNLMHRAAWLKQNAKPYTTEAAMAKLFASEMSSKAANHAVQVFGGYGYCNDYPAERYLRDAKITELYEGTSEIHRLVIGRNLLKDPERIVNQ